MKEQNTPATDRVAELRTTYTAAFKAGLKLGRKQGFRAYHTGVSGLSERLGPDSSGGQVAHLQAEVSGWQDKQKETQATVTVLAEALTTAQARLAELEVQLAAANAENATLDNVWRERLETAQAAFSQAVDGYKARIAKLELAAANRVHDDAPKAFRVIYNPTKEQVNELSFQVEGGERRYVFGLSLGCTYPDVRPAGLTSRLAWIMELPHFPGKLPAVEQPSKRAVKIFDLGESAKPKPVYAQMIGRAASAKPPRYQWLPVGCVIGEDCEQLPIGCTIEEEDEYWSAVNRWVCTGRDGEVVKENGQIYRRRKAPAKT